MKILGIIPARGGSKGLRMKNIRNLAGKPLIEYSISSAIRSRFINKIVVSTDNEKIAQISKKMGVEVPFLRPKKIATDNSLILDVIKHTLEFLFLEQSYVPDIIVLLQPTSPLRTTESIDKSIELLKNSNSTSIISVLKVKTHPYTSFWKYGRYLKSYRNDYSKYERRQKTPPLYYPTGSIYTFWHKTLKKFNNIYGPRIFPLIEKEPITDIDSYFDFFISEMTLLHWKKFQKKIHY